LEFFFSTTTLVQVHLHTVNPLFDGNISDVQVSITMFTH